MPGNPPTMTITGFETDEDHVVTVALEGMDKAADRRNITRVRVNGRPAPKPISIDFDAQEIVFDASECETGKITVEIENLLTAKKQSATSAEDYQAVEQSPDHEGADETATTINTIIPKTASPGQKVKIGGRNFARLKDVQLDRQKVPITKVGNTATFNVPRPFAVKRYPIRFHEDNAAGLVTSTVTLEVVDDPHNPYQDD